MDYFYVEKIILFDNKNWKIKYYLDNEQKFNQINSKIKYQGKMIQFDFLSTSSSSHAMHSTNFQTI